MKRYIAKAMIATIISAGALCANAEIPADTVSSPSELQEIVVTSTGPRKVLRIRSDGGLDISSAMLSEQFSTFGSNDPLSLIRSLPAVATANELSATLSIKGMDNGANYFSADGARIVNPLHLFGIYSTFNPAFIKTTASLPTVSTPRNKTLPAADSKPTADSSPTLLSPAPWQSVL